MKYWQRIILAAILPLLPASFFVTTHSYFLYVAELRIDAIAAKLATCLAAFLLALQDAWQVVRQPPDRIPAALRRSAAPPAHIAAVLFIFHLIAYPALAAATGRSATDGLWDLIVRSKIVGATILLLLIASLTLAITGRYLSSPAQTRHTIGVALAAILLIAAPYVYWLVAPQTAWWCGFLAGFAVLVAGIWLVLRLLPERLSA